MTSKYITISTSKGMCIQYVYVGSIRCCSECVTVYKMYRMFASPRFHMLHSHSHSDVNPALDGPTRKSGICKPLFLKWNFFSGEWNGNVTLAATITQHSLPKVRVLFYINFTPSNQTYSKSERTNIPVFYVDHTSSIMDRVWLPEK